MSTQTKTAAKVMNIRTKSHGTITVPVAWRGRFLAVHKPWKRDKATGTLVPTDERRCWNVSHMPTGFAAVHGLDATLETVKKLARLWDERFGDIAAEGDAKGWRWAKTWAEDVRRVNSGWEPEGPILPDCPNGGDVARAMEAALGGGSVVRDDDSDDDEQYPAAVTRRQSGAGAVRRSADGTLELYWVPRECYGRLGWYPVPTMGEVSRWVTDSIVESPGGDSVEPDAPDSWLSLLGLV